MKPKIHFPAPARLAMSREVSAELATAIGVAVIGMLGVLALLLSVLNA